MSWESTALYYRYVNEAVRDRLGGLASASLVLRSLDFREVRHLQVTGRWADAEALLLAEATTLVDGGGAELVVLCTNYMHKVAPALEAGLPVPFLHIADAVAAAAPGPTVGLLGAAATVREPFYRERLERHGLTVVVPCDEDIDRVDDAIFTELCRGILSDGTRRALADVVDRLARHGVDAVALACTELELLLVPETSPVPLLPSARLHAVAAVDAALAARPTLL